MSPDKDESELPRDEKDRKQGFFDTRKSFAEAFFQGSPFVRWTITPALLFLLIGLPLLVAFGPHVSTPRSPHDTLKVVVVLIAIEFYGWCVLAVFWVKTLAKICFRIVMSGVFSFYLVAFIDFLRDRGSSEPPRSWWEVIPALAFGLPCGYWALKGARFGEAKKTEKNDEEP